ncbi:MAG: hypothetical protein ACTSQI_12355 [Candidatus Helarchaeota archaeon]
MSVPGPDIELAATLIYYGLNRKIKPVKIPEYRSLVRKYKTESNFKTTVHRIASGLKLRVLAVEDFGIVLSPEAESVFAFTSKEIEEPLKPTERMIWGIILLGIAALLYPKKSSLDRDRMDEVLTITDIKIDKYIRERCETILNDSSYSDTLSATPELERMYREYLNLPQVDGEKLGSRSTTLYYIGRVFKFLVSQGVALHDIRDKGTLKILPHFRLLVEELVTNEQFKLFMGNFKERVINAESE